MDFLNRQVKRDRKINYYSGKRSDFIINRFKIFTGRDLQYLSTELRNNRDVVLAAVRNDGTALEFASNDLKNDRRIVEEALNNSVLALEFASPDLQNNSEIVKAVVLQLPDAIQFSESLKGDKGFIMNDELPKYVFSGFKYLTEELRNDVDVAKKAIEYSGTNLQYAGAGIRFWCKELVLSAVSRYEHAFDYVHKFSHLLHDTEILVAAVSLNWRNVKFLSRYTSAHVMEWLSKIAKEQLNESDHTYSNDLRFIDAFTTKKLEGHEKVAEKSWVNVVTGLHTLMRSENEEMPSYPKGFKQHQISYKGIFYNGNVDDIEQATQLPFTSADALTF